MVIGYNDKKEIKAIVVSFVDKIKESNLISPIVHSDKGLILARELFL